MLAVTQVGISNTLFKLAEYMTGHRMTLVNRVNQELNIGFP